MFTKLIAWFARRAQKARAQRYDAGFKWAAAELLTGRDVDYVERDIDNGWDMDGKRDPFDLGAKAACLAWRIQDHGRTESRYSVFRPLHAGLDRAPVQH